MLINLIFSSEYYIMSKTYEKYILQYKYILQSGQNHSNSFEQILSYFVQPKSIATFPRDTFIIIPRESECANLRSLTTWGPMFLQPVGGLPCRSERIVIQYRIIYPPVRLFFSILQSIWGEYYIIIRGKTSYTTQEICHKPIDTRFEFKSLDLVRDRVI